MIVWILASVAAIAAIAVGSLWWVTRRLARTEKSAIYDIADATEFVADRLPTALQGQLSFDDVERLILWHLDYLRHQGFVTYGEGDVEAQRAAIGGSDVIATEEDAVDALVGRSADEGFDDSELDIVAVVDLSGAYLEEIGAFGQRRILPADPPIDED